MLLKGAMSLNVLTGMCLFFQELIIGYAKQKRKCLQMKNVMNRGGTENDMVFTSPARISVLG